MGVEKQRSKGGGGGYVGGFLHLFDWNAKSRKKLFSGKSDSPEQPKQKKRSDGNLPMTRFNMMDEDETADSSSIKGSSYYSYASSVTDEDGYGAKAPGVIARLMGLDSLPTYTFSDTYSNPSFDSQSLRDSSAPYAKSIEHESKDCEMESPPRPIVPRPPKMAIEKFQTETLPPKSAKSISITTHKLLSPIKSSRFVSSDNRVRIMEAASRIPLAGSSSSSSVPHKREKVNNLTRKTRILETSRAPKVLKGKLTDKSWNGSLERKPLRVLEDEDKGKKSISLALQAKVNVQRREGLSLHSHHEDNGPKTIKSQLNIEKSSYKNPSANPSSVLKQNNQKQNSLVDRGKSTPKPSVSTITSQSRKLSQKSSSKTPENAKTSTKKAPYSASNNVVTRRKRSIEDSDCNRVEKNGVRDKSTRSGNSIQYKGTDVVSFTFTAPIARSMEKSNGFADTRGKKAMVNFDTSVKGQKSTSLSYNVIGGDALSALLEQKLKELTTGSPASVSRDSSNNMTPIFQGNRSRDGAGKDDLSFGFSSNDPLELLRKQNKPQALEEASECGSNDYEYRKFLYGRQPSPISVLEPSCMTESCNSSDTADSNSIEVCKETSSSVQARELLGQTFSKELTMMDIDTELSDSASSTSNKPVKWEQDYVKEVLSDIETMFEQFTIGKTHKIVNPRLFDLLESQKPVLEKQDEPEPKLRRKLMFDCVSECIDSRCRVWAKGLAAMRKRDRLAEDVYKQITKWEEMKDYVVDELVDKDMSGDQCGKWLDYDVEAFEIGVDIEGRLLNSLINELVADILVL